MMTLMINGEPYVFEHKCPASEVGQLMNNDEKREFLIQCLLDIYTTKCHKQASCCPKPELSFFDKMREKTIPWFYPDIVIDNFLGEEGKKAYYIVKPKGVNHGDIYVEKLPDFMQNSYVKLITGSVFCMEEQTQDKYVKGSHYAVQYITQAILPHQENKPIPEMLSERQLAELYAEAWYHLDASKLEAFLDKDFHYLSDFIFDEMSSRDEYMNFITRKFPMFKQAQSVLKVQLGRNGENGNWAALVKMRLKNGSTMVAGFMVHSKNGRIISIDVHEMDLPNF